MIKVYGFIPAWGQPCISPYVSKVCHYMQMRRIPYEFHGMNLVQLKHETPRGKLPLIDDGGTRVDDSNNIIAHLRARYPDDIDGDISPEEHAQAIAWDRLLGEHLYWSGVIQVRWRTVANWERYIGYIVGGAAVGPELREALEDFRYVILSEFYGQGMGRRSGAEVLALFKQDIDALSDFLGKKPFFLGEKPRWIDASVYTHLGHCMVVPFESEGKEYALGKGNLVDYLARMRERFGFAELTGK
jgi:glutathione S-transferase